MNPPKSSTTVRITADLGLASQYTNSPGTVIELKGRTAEEKGDHYLQLSLAALKELASLLETPRLSDSEKKAYHEAYIINRAQYDDLVRLRDQLLGQKKSLRQSLVNLFVRSDAKHFYKITYRNFKAIKRTSEDLVRRLLPNTQDILGPRGSVEGDVSVCEESPCEVVDGNISVRDLPPNETLQGISVDVHTEPEANEVLATLNRIAIAGEKDEDDDDRTIRASTSHRPSSPCSTCTVIYNYNVYNHSVVSVDSELTGTTINSGVDGGSSRSLSMAPRDSDDDDRGRLRLAH
ncbi:hypothetical protein EV702DRAFT_1266333 [Suillus placidus]|uniref:Uncharacterized protein n=1 Tax=Suillus placidus TaxID=48579 RepID=A0A9P7A2N5_9AGAM|nr:hypothetical protein EV702DRAFT_1266333 [Suillus placidus]